MTAMQRLPLAILLSVFPLLARAQYGFGPITSEEGSNSTSSQPLLADQSADLRAAGFILEYSLIGIVVESLLYGVSLMFCLTDLTAI